MQADTPDLEQWRQAWLTSHCESRHDLRRPLFQPLPAWLQAPALGVEALRADVLDQSAGGLCLALACPCSLQPGDDLQLRIEGGGLRRARVCWREETSLIVAVGVTYADS
jgi:hypothetical protein